MAVLHSEISFPEVESSTPNDKNRFTWRSVHTPLDSGGSRIFLRGADAHSQSGIIFSTFCGKLHENERIWTPVGRPSSPSLGSANAWLPQPKFNSGTEGWIQTRKGAMGIGRPMAYLHLLVNHFHCIDDSDFFLLKKKKSSTVHHAITN